MTEEHRMIVNSALTATTRTRTVFLSLQTLTLLILVMFINSGGGLDWTAERIRLAKVARTLYACGCLRNKDGKELSLSPVNLSEAPLTSLADQFIDNSGCFLCKSIQDIGLSRETVINGMKFILLKGLSRDEVDNWVRHFEGHSLNEVYSLPVPIPGVHVKIDINNFGPFAGVGLLLVLVWLGLSQMREYRNLLAASKIPGGLAILRGDQVLTPDGDTSIFAILRSSTMTVGLLFPIAILILVLHDDYASRGAGDMLVGSRYNTIFLAAETAILTFNCACAVWCETMHWRIDIFWMTDGAPNPRWPWARFTARVKRFADAIWSKMQ